MVSSAYKQIAYHMQKYCFYKFIISEQTIRRSLACVTAVTLSPGFLSPVNIDKKTAIEAYNPLEIGL